MLQWLLCVNCRSNMNPLINPASNLTWHDEARIKMVKAFSMLLVQISGSEFRHLQLDCKRSQETSLAQLFEEGFNHCLHLSIQWPSAALPASSSPSPSSWSNIILFVQLVPLSKPMIPKVRLHKPEDASQNLHPSSVWCSDFLSHLYTFPAPLSLWNTWSCKLLADPASAFVSPSWLPHNHSLQLYSTVCNSSARKHKHCSSTKDVWKVGRPPSPAKKRPKIRAWLILYPLRCLGSKASQGKVEWCIIIRKTCHAHG